MTAWSLAWRTIVHNPGRALLAIGGVAVIGALLFDMLLLSRGLLVSFRDLLDTAGYDVRVVASEGSPVHRAPLGGAAPLADAIRRLPGVQRVALLRTGNAMAMTPGREETAVGVTLIGSTESAMSGAWDIVKGSPLPAAVAAGEPTPLIVSTKLAELLGVGPGSPLRLRVSLDGGASALPALDCRVAGVGTFQFEAEDFYTVATTMAGFAAAQGAPDSEGDADLVLVASAPGVGPEAAVKAIAALRPDVRVYSNAQVVEQFNARAFTYFRQISVVLSSMTLVFAFLLVATLLTMSVNQRLGEVAALRANLLCESALLVGAGGAAALPLGGALAVVLDRILRGMPGLPERLHFFVFEPRTVMLHATLLAATGFFAALYPIWLAARLPIAATLRREIVS
jgi:ABC-type lipoprotein release transport system permease subunit